MKIEDITENDYISGEQFEKFPNQIPNTVFIKMDFVPQVLEKHARSWGVPFVMITHNSDYPIDEKRINFVRQFPNLKKWFGQNVEIENPSPFFDSIPCGIENDRNFTKFSKRLVMREKVLDFVGRKPSKLLYMNFSFGTNQEVRIPVWNTVKGNFSKHESYCTDKCNQAVNHDMFGSWLDDVLDHQFILCPRGNGIDTHRMWEVLYMGRIPVIQRNTNTRYYEDLPILFVDSYEQVTRDFLEQQTPRFQDLSKYNLEKLKVSWWKDRIHESVKNLCLKG